MEGARRINSDGAQLCNQWRAEKLDVEGACKFVLYEEQKQSKTKLKNAIKKLKEKQEPYVLVSAHCLGRKNSSIWIGGIDEACTYHGCTLKKGRIPKTKTSKSKNIESLVILLSRSQN